MIKFKNILIIDDDNVCSSLTKDEIINSQIAEKVEIANDGDEGLIKLKEFYFQNNYPELILLDINMPTMDGFEFLQEFNELKLVPKPKIIMFSSSLHPTDIQRSIALDAFGYMVKPFTANKLDIFLQKALSLV